MSEPEKKAASGMRPGFRFLLIGSLAVNLIIAGLVVGAAVGNKRSDTRPPRDGDILGAYTKALTKQERREIGLNIRDHHRAQGEKLLRPRQMMEQMLAALRADPFDPEAVQALIASQSDQAAERRAVAQGLWLQHVSEMTAAERADYADRIVETLASRRGPGSKKN